MSIHHLMIFLAVYEEHSITKAAKKLYISQPAVSKYIREIEQHYGKQLFERASRCLVPTSFGQDLYRYASQILSLYDEMNHALADSNWQNKSMSIGTATAIGELNMPSLIARYSQLHPDISISVTVSDTTSLTAKLLDNSIDFIISENFIDSPMITNIIIHQEKLVAICNIQEPLAQMTAVTAEELAQYPLLLGKVTRPIVEAYFQQHRLNINCKWESTTVLSLVNAVSRRLGISFQSRGHVLAINDPNIAILNVPDFNSYHNIYIQYRKNKKPSPAMQDFIKAYQVSITHCDTTSVNPAIATPLSTATLQEILI